jgi:hypothetical protein
MTQFMSRDVVSQGANAGSVSIGDTCPHERCVVQAVEEGNCGLPHQSEFMEKVPNVPVVCFGILGIVILVESRKFCAIVSRKPECPVNVDALIIHNVPEDFFDGPFPFRISMQQTSLRDRGNEFPGRLQVIVEMLQDQAIGRQ